MTPPKEAEDELVENELPRAASPADRDVLRATVRVQSRAQPLPVREVARTPDKPMPVVHALSVVPRAELDALIDQGRELLDGDPPAAHVIFESAYRKATADPRVLSNYGLTLVLVEGDRQRGIRFCEEAVRRGPVTTEALVNLAKALVQTRNKEQAVRALRKAMELAPSDPRVRSEFAALGLRRPPPIPWLPREFFLNKWIGMLTWKYSKKYRLDPLSHGHS